MACADNCKRATDPLSSGKDYAKCGGYALRDIDSADVTSYAQRSGAAGGDQLCYVSACLLTGRLIYWKNAPGDCPKETSISLRSAPGTVSKIIGSSSTTAEKAGFALPGLATLIAFPLGIWGIISAHHKIAVTREQATGCDVAQAYDQYELSIEDGIRSGRVSVADAREALPQVERQLLDALRVIRKECNTACFMEKALIALDLYAVEKLYDSLGPSKLGIGLGVAALGGAGIFAAIKLAGVLKPSAAAGAVA